MPRRLQMPLYSARDSLYAKLTASLDPASSQLAERKPSAVSPSARSAHSRSNATSAQQGASLDISTAGYRAPTAIKLALHLMRCRHILLPARHSPISLAASQAAWFSFAQGQQLWLHDQPAKDTPSSTSTAVSSSFSSLRSSRGPSADLVFIPQASPSASSTCSRTRAPSRPRRPTSTPRCVALSLAVAAVVVVVVVFEIQSLTLLPLARRSAPSTVSSSSVARSASAVTTCASCRPSSLPLSSCEQEELTCSLPSRTRSDQKRLKQPLYRHPADDIHIEPFNPRILATERK